MFRREKPKEEKFRRQEGLKYDKTYFQYNKTHITARRFCFATDSVLIFLVDDLDRSLEIRLRGVISRPMPHVVSGGIRGAGHVYLNPAELRVREPLRGIVGQQVLGA